MRTPAKFYLKSAWVLLWLFLLSAYQLDKLEIWPSPVLLYGVYVSPGWVGWLEPVMFFSCFPASLGYAMFVREAICTSSYSCSPDEEIFLWMGLFAVGTLQWFKLIPYFFRKVSITRLDISTAQSLPSTNAAVAALEATSNAPQAGAATPVVQESANRETLVQRTNEQEMSEQKTQAREPTFSHFDERGRTPLERVFDESG